MESLAKIGRWFCAISLVGLAGQQFYYGSFRPVFVPPFPSQIPGQVVLVYLFSLFLIGAAVARHCAGKKGTDHNAAPGRPVPRLVPFLPYTL